MVLSATRNRNSDSKALKEKRKCIRSHTRKREVQGGRGLDAMNQWFNEAPLFLRGWAALSDAEGS